jgi:hypothetical protein
MKNISIYSAYGSGNSFLKSLTLENRRMDPVIGTCHDSWTSNITSAGGTVNVYHFYNIDSAKKQNANDITVLLRINEKNIVQICQRIVVLDFLYANDTSLTAHDGAWNIKKHNALAGPDWPKFSTNINDYPEFCLNEICQSAYHRCENWTYPNNNFTFQIDSDELFGESDPIIIQEMLDDIGCTLDKVFLDNWKKKQKQTFLQYRHMFSWQPGMIDYMQPTVLNTKHIN